MVYRTSSSPCLVDAFVLVQGAHAGYLRHVGRRRRVGVSRATWRLACGDPDGPTDARLRVLSSLPQFDATAVELAAVRTRLACDGLSFGELESLALVVGRGFGYCTEERAAIAAMQALSVITRLVPLAELVQGAPRAWCVPEEGGSC